MDKKLKFILVFLGSGIAMFLIFYFYPAQIFEVELSTLVAEKEETVSLRQFFGWDQDFNRDLLSSGVEMTRKLSGWMIAVVCFLGVPAMLAYRLTMIGDTTKEKE
ncbi:hypothetical protein K6119_09095 [Paracrocinitomix mangrovi]|uniref:hypothetical protein n=1 Tax=Paracrocinitomix mangrovi TaxID=2862509 RepID=UPI001C8DE8ED|nr:hypothetical protein [Paracrocinitomix mangrovi]UKN03668.1 hypothetical protein K6119_09095 [Paracrocinitomix mangrovi]